LEPQEINLIDRPEEIRQGLELQEQRHLEVEHPDHGQVVVKGLPLNNKPLEENDHQCKSDQQVKEPHPPVVEARHLEVEHPDHGQVVKDLPLNNKLLEEKDHL